MYAQFRRPDGTVPYAREGWRCRAVRPNATQTTPQEPPPPSPTLPATPPPDPPSPSTLLPLLLVNMPALSAARRPAFRAMQARARVQRDKKGGVGSSRATKGIETHAHKWTAPTGLAALTTHGNTQAASACNTHENTGATKCCRRARANMRNLQLGILLGTCDALLGETRKLIPVVCPAYENCQCS